LIAAITRRMRTALRSTAAAASRASVLTRKVTLAMSFWATFDALPVTVTVPAAEAPGAAIASAAIAAAEARRVRVRVLPASKS
jgi:hypothetical protein